ncbi:unnamed protein product [Anisakis simplex]|uniref:Secreted protein n=1 Tax=Anisakis simplex TaxID=6269 RepID=A0A3P6PTM4_ANISI|nr:unnamed protein product [Anisakis simplex]
MMVIARMKMLVLFGRLIKSLLNVVKTALQCESIFENWTLLRRLNHDYRYSFTLLIQSTIRLITI